MCFEVDSGRRIWCILQRVRILAAQQINDKKKFLQYANIRKGFEMHLGANDTYDIRSFSLLSASFLTFKFHDEYVIILLLI